MTLRTIALLMSIGCSVEASAQMAVDSAMPAVYGVAIGMSWPDAIRAVSPTMTPSRIWIYDAYVDDSSYRMIVFTPISFRRSNQGESDFFGDIPPEEMTISFWENRVYGIVVRSINIDSGTSLTQSGPTYQALCSRISARFANGERILENVSEGTFTQWIHNGISLVAVEVPGTRVDNRHIMVLINDTAVVGRLPARSQVGPPPPHK